MLRGVLHASVLAFALSVSLSRRAPAVDAQASLTSYRFEVQRTLTHQGRPFTQGLEFTDNGNLVEASGSYPPGTESYVRIVNASTGSTLTQTSKGLSHRFVEGIVQLPYPGGHWFASTYQDGVVVEWDPSLQNVVNEHHFPYTGWGFTRSADGQGFLSTNGSAYVAHVDAQSFRITKSVPVRCLGYEVHGLNELEMVDDFLGQGKMLLGNIYETRLVLVLNPETMHCTGVLNLLGLGTYKAIESWGFEVANGVAFNRASRSFVVTGKNWPSMYEITIHADSSGQATEMLQRHLQGGPR